MKFDFSGRKLEIVPGCIACKTCEFMAPEVFRVEEKALSAEVLQEVPAAGLEASVLEAIRSCPEKVIRFVKRQGNE